MGRLAKSEAQRAGLMHVVNEVDGALVSDSQKAKPSEPD